MQQPVATGSAQESAAPIDPRRIAVRSMQIMADGTFEDFGEIVHPLAVNYEAEHEPPKSSSPGPDGFYASALWLRAAFSELDFDVHQVVVEGDLAVVHSTMSGRHTGAMVTYDQRLVEQVMPPTGRRFATKQSHWLRIQDGKVIEHWASRDDIGTAKQLGWVPPSPLFLLRSALATRRLRRLRPIA
ncbi:MAG TPA: ester cyclase [Kineosporiaceae bacterium]|nr:ester cyclase [Kineosporiaceae bacterium]